MGSRSLDAADRGNRGYENRAAFSTLCRDVIFPLLTLCLKLLALKSNGSETTTESLSLSSGARGLMAARVTVLAMAS
jgi:hypothetical protein